MTEEKLVQPEGTQEVIQETPEPIVEKKEKPWFKPLLFSILGLISAAGLVFAGYQLGRIQYAREQARQILEQEELTRCNQDGDCVLAIRLNTCCSCPQAISRQVLLKNKSWVEYEFGKDYSQEKRKSCQNVQCKPCSSPEQGLVCLSGHCQFSPFCGGIAGVECPSGYRCQLEGNYPDAGGKCVRE